MAEVLAINVKKCSEKQRWEEGKPTRKAAHQVERTVWFSSTDEQFEGIIRNARKKGILHGTTLWSLAALKWAPRRLSHSLICIQIFVASDFFLILAQKCLGFRSDFLMSAPRNVDFRAYF